LIVVVPLAVSLAVLYLADAQLRRAAEERQTLLRELRDDRNQLVKAALELAKEARATAPPNGLKTNGVGTAEIPELHDPPDELRHRLCVDPSAPPLIPGPSKRSVFGGGLTVNFEEVAEAVKKATIDAGPELAKKWIEIVGEGFEAGAKGFEAGTKAVGFAKGIKELLKDDHAPTASQQPLRSNPPETGTCATLLDKEVNFKFDSSDLSDDPGTIPALETVGERLKRENIAILIEGHADGQGKPAHNERLSDRRADAVKKFLIEKHVSPTLLHTHGYGQGYYWIPDAKDDPANRRVRIMQCRIGKIDRCVNPNIGVGSRGTDGSNPLPSSRQCVSPVPSRATGSDSRALAASARGLANSIWAQAVGQLTAPRPEPVIIATCSCSST
jgi:outer membrane protein OmpA-like peptidoglycan-associated protein